MALCSPTFPSTSAVVAGAATKRGCSTFNSLYTTPNKRICLNNKISAFGGIGFKGFYNSSLSSEEEDSESDSDNGAQSPFEAIQVRRKLIPTRKSSVVLAVTGSETEIENLDCSTVHYTDSQDDGNCDNNNSIPIADRNARTRCFEYLIGAIDEAWARYCDATTSFEDDVFGSNKSGTSTTKELTMESSTIIMMITRITTTTTTTMMMMKMTVLMKLLITILILQIILISHTNKQLHQHKHHLNQINRLVNYKI